MRPLWFERKNKYKAKRSGCQQNHIHDSAGEAEYCNQLELMRRAGEIKSYETQVYFNLHGVGGSPVARHKVDFLVKTKINTQEVHEFKGVETPEWKIKRKLFEAEYHGIKYVVISKAKRR
jgi:hypothetical protein